MMGREHLINLYHLKSEGVAVVAIADPHLPSQQQALNLAHSFNWPLQVLNWPQNLFFLVKGIADFLLLVLIEWCLIINVTRVGLWTWRSSFLFILVKGIVKFSVSCLVWLSGAKLVIYAYGNGFWKLQFYFILVGMWICRFFRVIRSCWIVDCAMYWLYRLRTWLIMKSWWILSATPNPIMCWWRSLSAQLLETAERLERT